MAYEEPRKCGYISVECKEKLAKYEVKLNSAVKWTGFVCQECMIAMQKVVYRNNAGKLEFREMNTPDWRSYESQTDPAHKGRNDHLA